MDLGKALVKDLGVLEATEINLCFLGLGSVGDSTTPPPFQATVACTAPPPQGGKVRKWNHEKARLPLECYQFPSALLGDPFRARLPT